MTFYCGNGIQNLVSVKWKFSNETGITDNQIIILNVYYIKKLFLPINEQCSYLKQTSHLIFSANLDCFFYDGNSVTGLNVKLHYKFFVLLNSF